DQGNRTRPRRHRRFLPKIELPGIGDEKFGDPFSRGMARGSARETAALETRSDGARDGDGDRERALRTRRRITRRDPADQIAGNARALRSSFDRAFAALSGIATFAIVDLREDEGENEDKVARHAGEEKRQRR